LKRRRLVILGVAVVLLGASAALWDASNQVLYPYVRDERWQAAFETRCEPWLDDVAYADLRGGGVAGDRPLELSCAQAAQLPGVDHEARRDDGKKVRWRQYPGPAQSPIWLHVHGGTGHLLHGTRYLPPARRLGFRLAVMELGNHGRSWHDGRGVAMGCLEGDDVAAVVADVARLEPGVPLLVHAASMGTMAAVRGLAGAPPAHVKALVLEGPLPSLGHILREGRNVPRVPGMVAAVVAWLAGVRRGVDFEACAPLHRLKDVAIPTWVVGTAQDNLVPRNWLDVTAQRLPAAAGVVVTQFEKGAHAAVWNGQPQAYEDGVAALWARGVAGGVNPGR
jgi:hypothetical protein